MTEIPEDIMERAHDLWRHPYVNEREGIEAIARAILAERERCAKVADKHATGGCACEGYGCTCGNYDDAGSAGGAATAKHIAAAIRGDSHE